jgi:hypothetical protein
MSAHSKESVGEYMKSFLAEARGKQKQEAVGISTTLQK